MTPVRHDDGHRLGRVDRAAPTDREDGVTLFRKVQLSSAMHFCLADVTEVLAAVGPQLDAGRQQKIGELKTRGERVQKKLFLKTQGGTDLAAKAADVATKLQALEFFIHRAETLVIRMT